MCSKGLINTLRTILLWVDSFCTKVARVLPPKNSPALSCSRIAIDGNAAAPFGPYLLAYRPNKKSATTAPNARP